MKLVTLILLAAAWLVAPALVAATYSTEATMSSIEGPGRTPLVLAARDVDPKSVRVVEENSQVCLLLEFAGKTREEVKKLAIENYGNRVRIQDSHGGLAEGGRSFGTYHERGLALQYDTKDQAEQVASLLRGESPK